MSFDKKAYNKEWRLRNKDRRKVYKKQWEIENQDKKKVYYRRANLKYTFGISIEDYDIMLKDQNESCAICKRHFSTFKRRLAVDHCHTTGQVRGLLCSTCNTGLGTYEKYKLIFDLYLKEKEGETFSKRYARLKEEG